MGKHTIGKGNTLIAVSYDTKAVLELLSLILNQPMKKLAAEAVYMLYDKFKNIESVATDRNVKKIFDDVIRQADLSEYLTRTNKKVPTKK